MVGAIIDAHPGRLRLLPILEAGCGIRIAEGLGLGKDDFDFDQDILHVRRQLKKLGPEHVFALPKNDRERDVPMPGWVKVTALQHFARYPAVPVTLPWEKPTGKLVTVKLAFTDEDGEFIRYRSYSQHTWKPGLVHAGVIPPPQKKDGHRNWKYETTRREGLHQLRHFYASVMLGDGASVTELAEYLGHHDPAVTLRTYGHMQQNSHDKARRIIDKRMFRPRAVGGESAE